ncbi:MAG: metallophosphoesterase [candidate division KSB1 bacterium]|nr:metallophosphoesterase [candidate division KSB1 bacterium]MDZ7335013.1 metallophosphoesterase [candidate division KSB1 bacterium]MDZ7358115.1 metallophosphoesterase [candidate division KSB1 bacterium]MDZ7400178.1 metallophosphoesterase [candidate division KSB1 bacterium]
MKSSIRIIALIVLILFCANFKGYRENNFFADFQAIIISDTHISNDESKDKRLAQLIDRINNDEFHSVALLFITGDLVACVYGNKEPGVPDESNNRIKKLQMILGELKIPYYLILGNHDYRFNRSSNSDRSFSLQEIERMEAIWKRDSGIEPYGAVEYQGWKFICLNSMRGRYLNRHFDGEQLDWLEAQLMDELPTILLFHHPLKTDHRRIWCKSKDLITPENEPRFFSLLENHKFQIKAIFVGHGHRWVMDTLFGKIKVFETDSFGESKGLLFYLVELDHRSFNLRTTKFKTIK